MNRDVIAERLAELPLYACFFIEPEKLEFSNRVRWICEYECGQFGKSWACPPGVGTVPQCRERLLGYSDCLVIATITEVADISDISETLSTRGAHEQVTDQAAEILRELGLEPFILSTESCAICDRCGILDGDRCRFPDRMHPCVESHGINVVPVLEENGLPFQFGQNVVTWVSLLFFSDTAYQILS